MSGEASVGKDAEGGDYDLEERLGYPRIGEM